MTDQENNLVGCVNPDGSKHCELAEHQMAIRDRDGQGRTAPLDIDGRRRAAGRAAVMFNGPRVNATYDPMRKQGAILLGNGGDNSNGSQGTFYEGAMTAAGTFPTDATDQQVQANVVAAGYGVLPVSMAPASATATPPGLQTFPRGLAGDTVTFTNTTARPRPTSS